MRCQNCGRPAGRVVATFDASGSVVERCAQCLGLSEAGGSRTTGALTRSSLRVRTQAVRDEGDMLPAHRWDKASRKLVPNTDLLDRYASNADQFYTETEAVKAGLPKLADHIAARKVQKRASKAAHASGVEFAGSTESGMKRTLGL